MIFAPPVMEKEEYVMSIKVGIIGYGFMGHEHAKMFADMDEIDVIAVCDIDDEQLKDVPTKVEIYKDARMAVKP